MEWTLQTDSKQFTDPSMKTKWLTSAFTEVLMLDDDYCEEDVMNENKDVGWRNFSMLRKRPFITPILFELHALQKQDI